jgi:hypothetical protein
VETPVLWQGRSAEEVERSARDVPLIEVKTLLDDAIRALSDDPHDESEPDDRS